MIKILIVDDEEEMRNLYTNILKKERYEIVTASNGIDALRCYEINHPELIITDLTMPLMSGVELITRIRSQNEAIPILVISGHVEVGDIPFNNLLMLQKPVSMKDIISAIKKLTRDEGRGTRDEGRGTRDEGRGTRDEGDCHP